MDRLHLLPDVVPQPLLLGSYAWPHLLWPATCAINVAHRQLEIDVMGQERWLELVMALEDTDEAHPIVASDGLIADGHKRGLVAERLFGWKESLDR